MVDNHGAHRQNAKSKSSSSTSSNVVGVHYRVGKKIGEGSFGVIYEGNQRIVWLMSLLSDTSIF
jgi:hypothetical protein